MRRFLAAQFARCFGPGGTDMRPRSGAPPIAFFLLVFLAFGVCLAVPELRLGFSAYLQHLSRAWT